MADEEPANIDLEHLKAIRAENAKTHERLDEIIGRISTLLMSDNFQAARMHKGRGGTPNGKA